MHSTPSSLRCARITVIQALSQQEAQIELDFIFIDNIMADAPQ
jgi:hypothetical protein